MRKTYINITALICVLIVVAIALGGILFTMVLINDVNSEFVRKVTATDDDFDVSRIEIERAENTEKTLVVFDGFRYLKNRTNPDIGHYGRYVYDNVISSDTAVGDNVYQSSFRVEINGNVDINGGDPALADFDISAPEGSFFILNPGGSVICYSVQITDRNVTVDTSPSMIMLQDQETPELQISEETEKQSELDSEAKEKFDELMNMYSFNENVTVFETGLITSHALVITTSSFEVPVTEDKIDIHKYDAYVFHPLAYVFSNYMHVYVLFLIMLIALIFLTIFMMRRMYVNRMSFEVRTKNLTRSFAHELKTPLAITQAYVENWELVEEQDRPEITEKITNEVEHMNKMVTTLLNLSAMDSGNVKLNLERVELFEFAKACYERIDHIAYERGIKFEFRKDTDEELYVMADLDMLNIVISNFLSNAIKYGKEKAEVSVSASGSNVVFRIKNDGDTISAKELKKIWDLFYKNDKSRTDRMGSNGVGLAVNKSILELHKAKFGAESRSGETTFWFEMKKANNDRRQIQASSRRR